MRKRIPVAFTIAGSDSGGGAGIQADLKTFAALGVHGTSAITCVTAQNPRRVTGVQACSAEMVTKQLHAVFDELPPAAIKTGMLYSEGIIATVAGVISQRAKKIPLIVDPVMVATSGARLLKSSAVRRLKSDLLPLATLITPNLDEVGVLLEEKPASLEQMRSAARELFERFGCAVLVKGGHLQGSSEGADIFFDATGEWLLTARFIRGVHNHGTGCVYSAAIAGGVALGHTLPRAVERAKNFISNAIANSHRAAGHDVLNCFWAAK